MDVQDTFYLGRGEEEDGSSTDWSSSAGEQHQSLLNKEHVGIQTLGSKNATSKGDPESASPANPRWRYTVIALAGSIAALMMIILALAAGLTPWLSGLNSQDGSHLYQQQRPDPQDEYVLSMDWDFAAPPTRREYNWTIRDVDYNPDGVYRPMLLINDQFPGPLIRCNEGDTLVIHVDNQATNATSIHWHGMYQNGTNWMDGTVGLTQCPIAPHTNFTYEFTVLGQAGTYWYHGHYGVQASDGIVGPLVVHSRAEKELQKIPYTTDRVVMVQDHYYDLSGVLMMQYLSPDRENAEPVPANALINGQNIRNCDDLPNRRCDNATGGAAVPTFDLAPDTSHRLRIINTGAFAEFQMQIDEHEFAVTEVDGTNVSPAYFHRLTILPAQRYSIILTTNHTCTPSYWLRARMVTHCFAEDNPEMIAEARAIIRYTSPDSSISDAQMQAMPPTSKDWPEVIEVTCRDFNISALQPLDAPLPPAHADSTVYLRANFEIGAWRLARGFFNSSSFRPNLRSPTLHRVAGNTSFPATAAPGVNALSFDTRRELVFQTPTTPQQESPPVIDVVVSNFDDGAHPLHLHGYKFWVLAAGKGYPPASAPPATPPADPTSGWMIYRDTATLPGFGWLWLRFVADNPGVWAFHCHMAWHSEAGLLMQFLIGAEEVRGWGLPGGMMEMCAMEGVERGAGPDDERWVGHFGD